MKNLVKNQLFFIQHRNISWLFIKIVATQHKIISSVNLFTIYNSGDIMTIVWGAGDFHLICNLTSKSKNIPLFPRPPSHTQNVFNFNLCVKVDTILFSTNLLQRKEMFLRLMIPVSCLYL